MFKVSLNRLFVIFVFVLCKFVLAGTSAYAQDEVAYQRFQWHKYTWKAYHTEEYNIYFPANVADSLYRFLVKETPDAIADLKKATINNIPEDLNIIIYPSIDQQYESNIGSLETEQFTTPTFVFKGARIVVAYTGNYRDLRSQLREGISRAIWEEVFKIKVSSHGSGKGENLPKPKVVPLWFKEGAIRYFAHQWPIEAEDQLRLAIQQNHLLDWQQVLDQFPRLGGQAFCYFLSQRYFSASVAQSLFQLKKKMTLDRTLKLITKQTVDSLFIECYDYYASRFKIEANDSFKSVHEAISIPHKKGIVSQVLFSKDRNKIAYTSLRRDKRAVYLFDKRNYQARKIATLKLPPWINEHRRDQYPLVSWDESGRYVYVLKPRKGRLEINRYTSDGRFDESVVMAGVDGVVDFKPIGGQQFLLTAFKKGQSDIVGYDSRKLKFTPYTDDEYDDSDPSFRPGTDDLYFVSDRPKEYRERRIYYIGVGYKKDTLWQGVYRKRGKEILPVVIDTLPYLKWNKPVFTDPDRLILTNTQSGSEHTVAFNPDNGNSTDLGCHIPYQYVDNLIIRARSDNDSIYATIDEFAAWTGQQNAAQSDASSHWLTDYSRERNKRLREDSIANRPRDTTSNLLSNLFRSPEEVRKREAKESLQRVAALDLRKVKKYTLQLHSTFFSVGLNNDYFINRFQPYRNYQGQFKFPEISGMAKGGFTDLFEDHKFSIAYRLPVKTDGSDFFIRYENKKRNFDWGATYFRKVEQLDPGLNKDWKDENGNPFPLNAKVKTHFYELFFHRPLSYYSVLGLNTSIRYDRTIFLATEKYSLDFPALKEAWATTTLSYNLNRLGPTIPLLYRGLSVGAAMDVLSSVSGDEAYVFNVSSGIRYHQPVYKYITLVLQANSGLSVGNKYILYNLGGRDNNLTPQVDTTVQFKQTAPYAFQTLATPFRGYRQNSLYGSQYLLFNMDVYFPVFQSLIPLETPLPFINNIQLGLLSDLATAKEAWNDSNSNNGKWFWSYGLSARSVLAGYPIRVDVAWPGTFAKRPIAYISLSIQ